MPEEDVPEGNPDDLPQPTPELFAKYHTYVEQRRQATMHDEDDAWRVQEPSLFKGYEEFATWMSEIPPLEQEVLVECLERGWESVRRMVEKVVAQTVDDEENILHPAAPAPWEYIEYVTYCKDLIDHGSRMLIPGSLFSIDTYEMFVMKWFKQDPEHRRRDAEKYEEGYVARYRRLFFHGQTGFKELE